MAHVDDGSKATWFHSLGYNRDKWQDLAADLLASAENCTSIETETTRFGVNKAMGTVGRPDFRPGIVVTVWIIADDEPPHWVTVYPANLPRSLNTRSLYLTLSRHMKTSRAAI